MHTVNKLIMKKIKLRIQKIKDYIICYLVFARFKIMEIF